MGCTLSLENISLLGLRGAVCFLALPLSDPKLLLLLLLLLLSLMLLKVAFPGSGGVISMLAVSDDFRFPLSNILEGAD